MRLLEAVYNTPDKDLVLQPYILSERALRTYESPGRALSFIINPETVLEAEYLKASSSRVDDGLRE